MNDQFKVLYFKFRGAVDALLDDVQKLSDDLNVLMEHLKEFRRAAVETTDAGNQPN